jgi:MFS family permease
MFGFYVTVPFTIQLNPLLLSRIGIGARNVPLCLTACQSMEVILLALLPMLLLRLGSKMTMVMGAFAWVLGLCALAVGQSAALVLPGLATGGVFICCFVIAGQVFVNSQATPDIRASAQGLLVFINGTGLLIGHFLVGMIRAATEDRFDLAYLIAAILSAVLCVLFTAGFTSLNAPKTAPDTLVADSEMA